MANKEDTGDIPDRRNIQQNHYTMHKKLTMFLAMICLAQIAAAQVGKTGDDKTGTQQPPSDSETFTFTEAAWRGR